MLSVEVISLPQQGFLVLKAKDSEIIIFENHLRQLKELKEPKNFAQYFLTKALLNRATRKIFEAWLRADQFLWQKIYKKVQEIELPPEEKTEPKDSSLTVHEDKEQLSVKSEDQKSIDESSSQEPLQQETVQESPEKTTTDNQITKTTQLAKTQATAKKDKVLKKKESQAKTDNVQSTKDKKISKTKSDSKSTSKIKKSTTKEKKSETKKDIKILKEKESKSKKDTKTSSKKSKTK